MPPHTGWDDYYMIEVPMDGQCADVKDLTATFWLGFARAANGQSTFTHR